MTDHFDGITMPFEASEPLNLKAENPGAKAEIDADVLAAIMRFDKAARDWGWQEDQGYDGTRIGESRAEYEAAQIHLMLSAAKAIQAERDKSQWQDISTAPKDGTEIYVYCGPAWSGRGPLVRTAWRGYWQNEFLNGGSPSNFVPTHWMPLPSPPTHASTKAIEGEKP